MNSHIRVTGSAQLNLQPDTCRVRLTLTGLSPTYGEAADLAATSLAGLNERLTALGFRAEQLKTSQLRINSEYEYHDQDGQPQRRLLGFRHTMELFIDLARSDTRLGEVIGALAEMRGEPELALEYRLAGDRAVREELLTLAVADAGKKAALLAAASGLSLGRILSIKHERAPYIPALQPLGLERGFKAFEAASLSDMAGSIEPEELSFTDQVDVSWTLENT